MALQLIFCIETNKKADTDKIYVMETLYRFYGNLLSKSREIKISYVRMEGKTNYNSRRVVSEIRERVGQYNESVGGRSQVIYCIDTDHFESNESQRRETERIEQYCLSKGYDFVWFCHDIEEVYIGQSVSKSDKKKTAVRFKKNKNIQNVEKSSLAATQRTSGKSNILAVTGKYLGSGW